MLRITIFDTPTERRLVVEGKLTEPWVQELESAWKNSGNERRDRKCIIDLSGTTVIDQWGKRILTAMCNEGVQFVTEGVETAHLIKDIERKCGRCSATQVKSAEAPVSLRSAQGKLSPAKSATMGRSPLQGHTRRDEKGNASE